MSSSNACNTHSAEELDFPTLNPTAFKYIVGGFEQKDAPPPEDEKDGAQVDVPHLEDDVYVPRPPQLLSKTMFDNGINIMAKSWGI